MDSQIERLVNYILRVLQNPAVYIAIAVGYLIGGLAGAGVGIFSGGFIGHALHAPKDELIFALADINSDTILGAFTGLFVGSQITSILVAFLSIFQVLKKYRDYSGFSRDEIFAVLLTCTGLCLEISLGMVIGACIGSLKSPGIGTIVGAFAGLLLMFVISNFKLKDKSLVEGV